MNTDLFTFGFTQTRMPDEQVYMVALAVSLFVCVAWSIICSFARLVALLVIRFVSRHRNRRVLAAVVENQNHQEAAP